MTRKDYVALSSALIVSRPSYAGNDTTPEQRQWEADVKAIGNALLADNPRFDRTRFVKACLGGMSDGK